LPRCLVGLLHAATVSWGGGGGDDSWHTAANWSGDAVPTAQDDVVINRPATLTVVLSQGSVAVRACNAPTACSRHRTTSPGVMS
jgi:hypothetical protein